MTDKSKVYFLLSLVAMSFAALIFKFANLNKISSLPYLKNEKSRIYYIRYEAMTKKYGRIGTAYFIYPIRANKREFVKIQYSAPLYNFWNLFAGGEILGSSALVELKSNRFLSEETPFSKSSNQNAPETWKMKYWNKEYLCNEKISLSNKHLGVCKSGGSTLSFSYESGKGIVSYQDFCHDEICKYRLVDSIGIFSTAHLDYIGF